MRMASLVTAFVVVFLLTAVPGAVTIGWLRKLGAKQNISADAPTGHAAKQGTPTMGGLMFLAPFVLVVGGFVAANSLQHSGLGTSRGFASSNTEPALLPIFLMTLGFAAIGFADDYLSARRGKNLGLTSPQKFIAQCII